MDNNNNNNNMNNKNNNKNNNDNYKCPICLEDCYNGNNDNYDNYDNYDSNESNDNNNETYRKTILLECKHMFHIECLKKIKNDTCPLCRQKINFNTLLDLNETQTICKGLNCNNYGYCPYNKNGSCRFCYGYTIEYFISLKS